VIEVSRLAGWRRRVTAVLSRAWSLLHRGGGEISAASVRVAAAEQAPLVLAPVLHLYRRRPVLVAEDLGMLRGPASGVVTLPVSLHWSGDEDAAVFDLSDPRQRPGLYTAVLREAGSAEDLQTWINAGLLVELWPRLVLPRTVRAAWEEQHPVLLAAGAGRRLRAAS
jgi:hypothetical protein